MSSRSIPLWVVRVTAVLLLVLGLVIWTGNADWLISSHIVLGVILAVALLVIAIQALRAGVARGLAAVSIVWAVALPVLGLTQSAFSESLTLFVQVFHLLAGLGAWVLAELLVRQMPVKRARKKR